ncbi:hypothetical protein ACTJJ4_07625 [Microbacterium sp. 22195]|uniref:hypothetical protein n=1 Tax=Microbacterium sp. 22195 TaxID=3453891 RepID=UPI003F859658
MRLAPALRARISAEGERILAEALTVSPREVGALTASAPRPPFVARRRSLRCWLGFHQWKYFTLVLFGVIDMGVQRRSCELCGKWARA